MATDGSVSQRIEFWRETILRLFADVQIAAVQKVAAPRAGSTGNAACAVIDWTRRF
ncbi:hypothetical protein [Burkholderia seminalis]|uniref:hypothetical protein n=1 Tax=Burkholderia seminalis TaxID=488731 RepID=UPI0031DC4916